MLKSELSTSVPVATPVVAVGASSDRAAPPLPSKEGERHLHTPAEGALLQDTPKPGGHTEQNIICIVFLLSDCELKKKFFSSLKASSPQSLRSIMKRKAEGEPGSPSTKKNLQFIGVNGG